jgi:predicted GIY-YIG superfamily endonuclease
MSGVYTYILGNHTGTLYIGVTSDLYLRVMQSKEGTWEGFTATYGCKRPRLRWSKSSEQHGQNKHRRGSLGYSRGRLFDSAPQALCHAINL